MYLTARMVIVMRINTLFYSIKQGFKNIFRNKMFSLASIATMAACIFMFGLFYIVVTNFSSLVKTAEEGVAVTVFFNEGTTEDVIKADKAQIEKRAEVGKVDYQSAADAWSDYQKEYFEGYDDAAASFGDDNPLSNSANLQVYLNDVSMQQTLVNYIKGLEGVRKVNQSQDVANTLTDLNKLISYVSGGIILILLCVAIFLISNTVTTGIAVRREEIAIMKLIGATDFLVRSPFVVEGILIGLIGSAIPLGLLGVMYGKICAYIANKFSFIGNMMTFIPTKEIFSTLVPVALILGVGIGFLGSRFTIRKHLRV